jgi:malate/lactate dehydrogenase
MATVKVTIVGGAGGVGASTAFNLVLMRGGDEIVLVDKRSEMVTSHEWELAPEKLDALRASADFVRVATESIR